MKELFYSWIRNLVFYQLLAAIVQNIIPGTSYQKYVRFFLGMLFILIALYPVLELFHLSEQINADYIRELYEKERMEQELELDIESITETIEGELSHEEDQ